MPSARCGACLAAALLVAGCGPGGDDPLTPGGREDLRRRVEDLYQRARDAGETVPADAYEWAREDVGRIGDWEYRVLRLDLESADADLEARLDELGAERWELVWLEPDGRAWLKRPTRSYLRHLPLSELDRLAP